MVEGHKGVSRSHRNGQKQWESARWWTSSNDQHGDKSWRPIPRNICVVDGRHGSLTKAMTAPLRRHCLRLSGTHAAFAPPSNLYRRTTECDPFLRLHLPSTCIVFHSWSRSCCIPARRPVTMISTSPCAHDQSGSSVIMQGDVLFLAAISYGVDFGTLKDSGLRKDRYLRHASLPIVTCVFAVLRFEERIMNASSSMKGFIGHIIFVEVERSWWRSCCQFWGQRYFRSADLQDI
ncbi:hypothetical protein BKA93DRAFT_474291 [Sparassis latifolia]